MLRKASISTFLCVSFLVLFNQTGQGQDIKKQLKAANKAEKNLQWHAAELFQTVLDNPAFSSLSLGDKLTVYDRLTWYYNVFEKYGQAEPLASEAVRLREVGVLAENEKKDKFIVFYVSKESLWYTQALHSYAQTLLALGKYKQSQDIFRQAIKASEKYNANDKFLRWQLLTGIGRSYYLAGDHPTAIPPYEEASKLSYVDGEGRTVYPYATHLMNSEANCELANMYRDRGDLKKAEELYTLAIKIMDADVYTGRPIKAYDKIRIKNFLSFAQLLRIQKRNDEADAFEAKAKELQQLYK